MEGQWGIHRKDDPGTHASLRWSSSQTIKELYIFDQTILDTVRNKKHRNDVSKLENHLVR